MTDLMLNDKAKVAMHRSLLKSCTREFFGQQNFCEVDTPIITKCPGTEVYLQYFATDYEDHRQTIHRRWLRSSPELHMKRLVAAGLPKIFQFAPCFRNRGEQSEWHNPEFTMLEWYHVGQTYSELIANTEQYLRYTADKMATTTARTPEMILPVSFKKYGVYDLFKDVLGFDLFDLDPALGRKAKAAGVLSAAESDDFDTIFCKILIEKIEPILRDAGGAILMDYPPSQAALAAVDRDRACRFEFYLGRVELCNGFYELTGVEANKQRIREALQSRINVGNSEIPEDEDFYCDMAKFIKPCAGNALGFDRWLALLLGHDSLDGSIMFRGI